MGFPHGVNGYLLYDPLMMNINRNILIEVVIDGAGSEKAISGNS